MRHIKVMVVGALASALLWAPGCRPSPQERPADQQGTGGAGVGGQEQDVGGAGGVGGREPGRIGTGGTGAGDTRTDDRDTGGAGEVDEPGTGGAGEVDEPGTGGADTGEFEEPGR